MAESECYRLLKEALSLDESGQKSEAIKAYSEAVQAILNLNAPEKEKLKHFAVDALERAEKIKTQLHGGSHTIHQEPLMNATGSGSGKKRLIDDES